VGVGGASPFRIRRAVCLLRRGGLLAYPTEAVYGLGCDPLNGAAVARLLALKERPLHKGLILIAAEPAQLAPFIAPLDDRQWAPALATWPGPHTWLFPAAPGLPAWINGGGPSVAVRVTAHPLAAELCRRFGGALVSTSANLSGRPPARTPLQVRRRCPGVDAILHGATGGLARPTPIRHLLDGRLVRS